MLSVLRKGQGQALAKTLIRKFGSTTSGRSGKSSLSLTKILFVSPPLLIGGWIATSEHPRASAALAIHFPLRLARDIYCVAGIVQDYRNSLGDLDEDREYRKSLCHHRSAEKLVQLCFANGGIYIKLGQVAAQMDHLLPEEYVQTMRDSLLDKCPVSSFAQVVQTLDEELGAPPSVLFAEFDPEPIASASLAQVHRAVSHEGEELAVKVQHPGLLDTYAADVATVAALVFAVRLIFPDFDYSWLVAEIRRTLPKELDFSQEAENTDRCRANFQSKQSRVKGRVHVPMVHHEQSSKRVLTMEYINGVKVTEKELLEWGGINPQEVAQLVSEAFSEMIFTFGDVHCDPHAANLLVRHDKKGGPQLVLLDHGLYKQLSEDLRLDYAGLWQALIFGNEKGIKEHSSKMNAGDMYPLFAAMLTSRPWEEVTRKTADHLYIPRTAEERKVLQRRAAMFSKEINEMLGKMPQDLLLLLKTNDCLRSVDLALGQPVNTFIITARECSRALGQHRLKLHPGIMTWMAVKTDSLRTELVVAVLKFMSWWSGLRFGFWAQKDNTSGGFSGHPAYAI